MNFWSKNVFPQVAQNNIEVCLQTPVGSAFAQKTSVALVQTSQQTWDTHHQLKPVCKPARTLQTRRQAWSNFKVKVDICICDLSNRFYKKGKTVCC